MKKKDFSAVVEKIEQFASGLIMLDVLSPGDIESLIQDLKDIQALAQSSGDKHLDGIFALIFKAINVVGENDAGRIQAVFEHSIGFLQYAVNELQEGNDPRSEIKPFVDQMDGIIGIQEAAPRTILDSQAKELPDFISSTRARVDDIEGILLDLERTPDDSEKINSVFRAFHTIKGESNFLGIVNLAALAHEAENLLEHIRSQRFSVDGHITGTLLGTIDVVKELLALLVKDVAQGLGFDTSMARERILVVLEQKMESPAGRNTGTDAGSSGGDRVVDSPEFQNLSLEEKKVASDMECPERAPEIRELDDESASAGCPVPGSSDVQDGESGLSAKPSAGDEAPESSGGKNEDAVIEMTPVPPTEGPVPENEVSPGPAFPDQDTSAPPVEFPAQEFPGTAKDADIEPASQEGAVESVPAPAETPPESLPKPPEDDFVPTIPTVDLSEGTEILVEFTTEAYDHLANAEDSILALETSPENKESIDNIFRAFHTIKGVSSFLDLDDIRILAHEAETMLDMVRAGKLSFFGQVADLTFHSVDNLRTLLMLLRKQVENGGSLNEPYHDVGPVIRGLKAVIHGEVEIVIPDKEPLGEILIKDESITEDELDRALAKQRGSEADRKIGEILVEDHAASQKQVNKGLAVQGGVAVEDTIKINIGKLDMLYDLVGELVIGTEQVVQDPVLCDSGEQRLEKSVSQLNQITRNLQEVTMSMRLVPIRSTFQKMNRLIRDLSKKAGKDISVTMIGEDTEIDKNMVDLVGDPLIHMVRNSVDHGIEPAQERIGKGKSVQGHIELRAFHRGGNVVIEIMDDGGGLNRDRILRKAIERNLVKDGENLTDSKIFNMIFEPGFSTAEKITDVSGRGVGMDVVKRNIERLRGRIDISSEQDKGAVFAIHLPITLAIIEGIVLEVGVERYILPITSVVEFIRPQDKDVTVIAGKRDVIKIQGNLYPILRLGELFGVEAGCRPDEMTACLVESELGRVCVLVDRLLGQQQVVIKSLGDKLKDVKGLTGATILGDGRVGLILDVNGIVEISREAPVA